MADGEGIISFSGINDILSGTINLSQGISPAASTIKMPPQLRDFREGNLVIGYAGRSFTLTGCIVDKGDIVLEQNADYWVVSILDRRWKWRFPKYLLNGYYNVRRGAGLTTSVVESTVKKPAELFHLCFEAIGEKRYTLNDIPEGIFPEIEWDDVEPIQALGRLCDEFSLRIVQHLNDTYSVEPKGIGRVLPGPPDGTLLSGGATVDPPEMPDVIIFSGAPTKWQQDFELVPVLRRPDGYIIDLTSHDDANGDEARELFFGDKFIQWEWLDLPECNRVIKKYRSIVRECAFKWWRLKTPFELSFTDGIQEIDDVSRILPLHDVQVETYWHTTLTRQGVEWREEPLPAWVYGTWWSKNDTGADGVAREELNRELESRYGIPNLAPVLMNNGLTQGLYTEGFSIDKEVGLVKFGQPVSSFTELVLNEKGGKTRGVKIPTLFLRTAVSLRDPDTRGWIRNTVSRKLDGRNRRPGERPLFVKRDDVSFHIAYSYIQKRWITNEQDFNSQANYHLDVTQRNLRNPEPSQVEYGGFRFDIDLDGAIQQIQYVIDEEGFAKTSASRNCDLDSSYTTYGENRMAQRLNAYLDQVEYETNNQKREKLHRGRA